MAIYEYYCPMCNKHLEAINRMGDFTSPMCCGGDMVKLISLPQPAIFSVTNTQMFKNTLNDDEKAYKFPGRPEQQVRYKDALKKSLTREREIIGRGF